VLEASETFTKLPLSIGAAKLEAVALPAVTLIAPLKGQMMAVADALKSDIGMVLPPAGQCAESARARAYWRAPGQWLVFGALDTRKLAGMAAVADMSDAFARLRLSNGATALARLMEVDFEMMQAGHVAHSVLADISVTLIITADAVELMVPRSYAQSAVARISVAMG